MAGTRAVLGGDIDVVSRRDRSLKKSEEKAREKRKKEFAEWLLSHAAHDRRPVPSSHIMIQSSAATSPSLFLSGHSSLSLLLQQSQSSSNQPTFSAYQLSPVISSQSYTCSSFDLATIVHRVLTLSASYRISALILSFWHISELNISPKLAK